MAISTDALRILNGWLSANEPPAPPVIPSVFEQGVLQALKASGKTLNDLAALVKELTK